MVTTPDGGVYLIALEIKFLRTKLSRSLSETKVSEGGIWLTRVISLDSQTEESWLITSSTVSLRLRLEFMIWLWSSSAWAHSKRLSIKLWTVLIWPVTFGSISSSSVWEINSFFQMSSMALSELRGVLRSWERTENKRCLILLDSVKAKLDSCSFLAWFSISSFFDWSWTSKLLVSLWAFASCSFFLLWKIQVPTSPINSTPAPKSNSFFRLMLRSKNSCSLVNRWFSSSFFFVSYFISSSSVISLFCSVRSSCILWSFFLANCRAFL